MEGGRIPYCVLRNYAQDCRRVRSALGIRSRGLNTWAESMIDGRQVRPTWELPSRRRAALASDTASFTSAIRAQVGERLGFPGNPIFKTMRKPLKNGVKIG